MKCEVVSEGQSCKNDAEFIVRTPWTTQLACVECAKSFKRYDVEKLEFTCDWPMGGKECGRIAAYYLHASDDGKHVYQRPLCFEHARLCSLGQHVLLITDDKFDPKLVPHKPPVQLQPRVVVGGPKAGLWCHCGKEGKYRPGETMPLCDEHAPRTTTPKAEPPSEQEFSGGFDREPIDDIFLGRKLPTTPDIFTEGDRWTPSASTASVGDALKDLALTTIRILKEKIEKWR